MVNVLATYETRVVLLLEKGDQLAKEPSIDEADRKQTEDDTKALRERWDRLKADEQDKKKRFVRDFMLFTIVDDKSGCSMRPDIV